MRCRLSGRLLFTGSQSRRIQRRFGGTSTGFTRLRLRLLTYHFISLYLHFTVQYSTKVAFNYKKVLKNLLLNI